MVMCYLTVDKFKRRLAFPVSMLVQWPKIMHWLNCGISGLQIRGIQKSCMIEIFLERKSWLRFWSCNTWDNLFHYDGMCVAIGGDMQTCFQLGPCVLCSIDWVWEIMQGMHYYFCTYCQVVKDFHAREICS